MVTRTLIIDPVYRPEETSTRDDWLDYQLKFISNRPPSKIVDIGCGSNWVKQLPCMKQHFVTGIDFDTSDAHGDLPKPDINTYFPLLHTRDGVVNDTWVQDNQESFDCGVALCSLHYCLLQDLPAQIDIALQLIKPGGMLFVTVNTQRMYMKAIEMGVTQSTNQMIKDFGHPWIVNYCKWLEQQNCNGTIHNVMGWNSENEVKGNVMLLVSK